ncbi:MAG: hypothetical protein ACK2T0_15420, partial [Anaerolineales bacterium]
MSLLKRIEQGQSGQGEQHALEGPGVGGNGKQGGETSRLGALQLRRPGGTSTTPQAGSYFDLKTRVQNKLLAELDPATDITKTDEVRKTIQGLFEQILAEERIVLSRPERARLFDQITAEILGLGPIQPLLEDESITEIMVNGPKNVYIERNGKILDRGLAFGHIAPGKRQQDMLRARHEDGGVGVELFVRGVGIILVRNRGAPV